MPAPRSNPVITRTLRKPGRRARVASPSLHRRLSRISLFLCDVDGVLTDGSVFIGRDQEFKQFDIQDGLGLITLQREGIRVGWVSSRPSPATVARAEDLKIDFLQQVKGGKLAAVEQVLAQAGVGWPELCYVGDDLVDLGVIGRAGVGVAVANAIAEAKDAADYVTRSRGGHGAIREIAEMILKAQNKWERIVARHRSQ
jgi:3-deoxy-D-manno-octulosonate 8-phosphate phosphatase (KDO 8-P phosphatase)